MALPWWSQDSGSAVRNSLSAGWSRLQNSFEYDDDDDDLLGSEKESTTELLAPICWNLVPSFIAQRYGHSDVEFPKPNATSYLNGVRGLAACIVVTFHATSEYFWHINVAYVPTPPNNRIVQMPIIRAFLSGHLMVAIFFVLSGFVLSYGPLKKAHANDSAGAIASIPSSVVRRPIRLFLPALPSFLITAVAIWMHIFWADFSTALYPSSGSLWGDLSSSVHQWLTISWRPLNWETYQPPFNPTCWTLGIELRGSIAIFIMVVALARVSPWLRMSLVSLCAWDALHNPDRWSICLFLFGMVLADVRHLRATRPRPPRLIRQAIKLGSYCLLVLGLFFGGWPAIDFYKGTWYSHFSTWRAVVHYHSGVNFYWVSLGAMMVMTALENLPKLQNFFNHPVLLYLGEISYGLYLIHYWVLHVIAKPVIYALRADGSGPSSSALFGAFVGITISLWFADVYWRLIDVKSIKFARWLVEKIGV